MELDHELCYAISRSRDERFDGRFFIGVLTTGVYCRTVCPAPCPRPENIRFYPTAAAAAAAGFRPCLRCRPEAAPGTPAWQGPPALVSRALLLIAEGLLDEEGVEGLARRLNVGARQLRRLFLQQVGASPLAVAQTRRIHFAKTLIDETSLPLADVAFSAGFSSIRRFNAAFRQAYGRAPSQLRRHSRARPASEDCAIELRLAYRPPYDWPALIGFLGARAIPGVEAVDPRAYRRTVRIAGAAGVIEVRPVEGRRQLRLTVPGGLSPHLAQIVERVKRMFDLKADPAVYAGHLAADPLLAPRVRAHPGLRLPGAWDGFEIAVRAILGQQVSLRGANTLAGRLVAACGEPLPAPQAGLGCLFPTAERLAEARLAGLGLTRSRAEAIRGLARAVADGSLALATPPGLEEALAALTDLPGIGPWTAHYIALRAFGEPDAFPAGDLGLRRAASGPPQALAGEAGRPLPEAALRRRAEAWRPWRAYAAAYLWT
jgi:AraC family transcriptional regulator of adaptative response / DNA-3-methyladenine glycosylase II